MRILLFDLDGVLLEPRGYHRALRETTTLVGQWLGYRRVTLTRGDIELFESVDVTSEWDSAAICAALLLRDAWTISPDLMLATAPPSPDQPTHDLPAPDFQAFFRSEQMAPERGTLPTLLAERSLLSDGYDYSDSQIAALRGMLRGARQIHGSLTHRLFQEMVLGSQVFRDTYSMKPYLPSRDSLLADDRPMLPAAARERLLNWLRRTDHHAAVFTNRPSEGPQDAIGAPEAELGLAAAELEHLPLVGRGGLAWLSEQRGLAPDRLLKPSAAHALAALRRATGEPLEAALRAAAALTLDEQGDSGWRVFAGAEIFVFEDSVKGLHSLRAAKVRLESLGVACRPILVGVTKSLHKRQGLEAAGAQMFSDIEQAMTQSGALA